jgi:hypothetical protein
MARRTPRNGTQDARIEERASGNGGGDRESGERATKRRGAPTPEQIAARAYEIFLERGGEHGRHDEDWLRAEQELRTTDPSISLPTGDRRSS